MKERLADRGFAAGWSVVKALPEPVARTLFQTAADLAVRRSGSGVGQLRANLRRVLGPSTPEATLEELVRRGMRSYARYWRETFRLPVMDPVDVMARTEVTGWEHVDGVRSAGRGIVAALTHSGNWDAAGIVYRDHLGEPFTTVAERLRPEALYDRFVAYRERLGMEVLPLTGGERPVASVLTERLRAGRCVCLLADRDLSAQGMPVQFFGETATVPPGPALLAATTGAALVPMNGSFTENGWRMHFSAEVEIPITGRLRERVATATQALMTVFEGGVSAHPEDWHMLRPLWTADRPARASR
ncbi:MAG: phosphatidylinositol mannoside acyltransferase [Geodermatophilaceae bacterium]|nr:phosphatidylinositol mannoside acyltransferase [Geodermatophilaceae bacterium]MDQ3463736.1 phosphatidylinositol mannoside acyltransferase [Actinomycetota bacterium]